MDSGRDTATFATELDSASREDRVSPIRIYQFASCCVPAVDPVTANVEFAQVFPPLASCPTSFVAPADRRTCLHMQPARHEHSGLVLLGCPRSMNVRLAIEASDMACSFGSQKLKNCTSWGWLGHGPSLVHGVSLAWSYGADEHI